MKDDNKKIAALKWARKTLIKSSYKFKFSDPETIKHTPWSFVIQFETEEGKIYLKQMPEKISMEPDVIKLLKEKFNAEVPEVIAQNDELNCFLMKDAGRPLRLKLKETFDDEYLCDAAERFIALQLNVAKHLDLFFEIGVPDWRLDKLPGLYREVVNDDDLLLSEGFSIDQIKKLHSFESKIIEWSEALAEYQIPESIIQPDFHDNNVLIDDDTGKLTWIDLGEVLISHPFFPLFNYLWQIKKHHGLKEGDVEYEKIKNVCFQPYRKMIDAGGSFNNAITFAEKLNWVYGVVYQYRFMNICGKNQLITANQWKLKNVINGLMEIMK